MRAKTVKLLRKFARVSYDNTPENQRPHTLKNYLKNIKREKNRNPKMLDFIKSLLKTV